MARGDERSTDPFADSGEPVEVARVHHDDAFLDAIAGDGRVSTESNDEYQLALLFAQWRTDIDREPMPAGPTLDEVLAAIEVQEQQQRPRESTVLRFLRPVGRVAAAFLIVGGAATVVFSYNAQPGDPLWSIKSVVFSSEANATMAKVDTSTALDAAANSLEVQDTAAAQTSLTEAQERIEAVNNDGDKNVLEERLTALRAELDALLQEHLQREEQAAIPAPSTTTSPETTTPETTQPPATTTPDPAPVIPPQPGWTFPTELPQLPDPQDLTLPPLEVPTLLPEVPPQILMEPAEPSAPESTGGPSLPTLEPAPPVTTTTPLPAN